MANGFSRPGSEEFGARLLTGLLDGWTARHQQGLAQKRKDELYAKQLADQERMAQQKQENWLEGIKFQDELARNRAEEAKPSQQDVMKSFDEWKKRQDYEHDLRMKELESAAKYRVDQLKPPKPHDPTKLARIIDTYDSSPWAQENKSDLVRVVKETLPPDEDFTTNYYDRAKRIVATENVGLTVSSPQSPVSAFTRQLKDDSGKPRSVDDKFIPAEDAAVILGANGLFEGALPQGMYSPKDLAQIVVYNSPDPTSYDIFDPRTQRDLQPIGMLEGAIWEILHNYMPAKEEKRGIGFGANIVGPPGSEIAIPTIKGLEPVMKAFGSFARELPGRAKEEAAKFRPARR